MVQSKRTYSGAMYYSTTSNAYKYDEPAFESPERKQRVKERSAARVEPKLNIKAVAAACALVLFVAAVAVLLIMRYERMSAASMRISKLRSEINSIETDIETLNIKLEYAMDINTAQIIARESLGMDYPDASQIESIEPNADGVIGMQESRVNGNTPVYAAIPVLTQEEQGGN